MSAALVQYPRRRVVLLIDDPPDPTTPMEIKRLNRSRELVSELQSKFAVAAQPFEKALFEFQIHQRGGSLHLSW
jgi:hypothetical protein